MRRSVRRALSRKALSCATCLIPGYRACGNAQFRELRAGPHTLPNLISQPVHGLCVPSSFSRQAERKPACPGHPIAIASERLNDDRDLHGRSPLRIVPDTHYPLVITGREKTQRGSDDDPFLPEHPEVRNLWIEGNLPRADRRSRKRAIP
jgi:hypothetical protein